MTDKIKSFGDLEKAVKATKMNIKDIRKGAPIEFTEWVKGHNVGLKVALEKIGEVRKSIEAEAERHEKEAEEIAKVSDEHGFAYPSIWHNNINRADELRRTLGTGFGQAFSVKKKVVGDGKSG